MIIYYRTFLKNQVSESIQGFLGTLFVSGIIHLVYYNAKISQFRILNASIKNLATGKRKVFEIYSCFG